MRWDIQTETNNQQEYSTLDTLFGTENSMQGFAYCLPRYSKLNGDYINAPDNIPYGLGGYISDSISDRDCNFVFTPFASLSSTNHFLTFSAQVSIALFDS